MWVVDAGFATGNVRLVVIDSIAALFRVEYDASEGITRSHDLFRFGRLMKRLSDEYHAPFVCINQVSDFFQSGSGTMREDMSIRQVIPALGMHACKSRVFSVWSSVSGLLRVGAP